MKTGRGRILLGKMGLDSHDTGIVIVAKWLSDAGFEVIYAGLYNTPENIIESAIQEGVDIIGCSFLAGEHLYFTRKLVKLMDERDLKKIKLIIGGVILPDDVIKLKELGVSHVFTPETMRDTIIDSMIELAGE
ncbi:cobalamin B12-binding domain-containing protein [Thermodesulfobacteriota bacterium]